MEPLTGLVLQARKALMLSTHIGPRYRVVDSGLAADAFVPIMEVEERGVGTYDQLQDARRLQRAVGLCVWGAKYLPWVGWVGIVAGVVMITLSINRDEPGQDEASCEEVGHYETLPSEAED